MKTWKQKNLGWIRQKLGGKILLAALLAASLMTNATAAVTGTKTAIVMLVNLNDAPIECSTSYVNNKWFVASPLNIKAFYEHSSYGNMTWSGNVLTVSINYSKNTCQRDTWADAADNAARAQGFEPLNYTVRCYAFSSSVPNCGYALAAGNRVWNFHCSDLFAYGHEVGHSLGMHHASTDSDNNGTIDNEYGGNDDCMGGESYVANAPHKIQMGWLPQRSSNGGWRQITSDGTYQLSPLELYPSSNPPLSQAFKIVPPSGDPYFFSYRQPLDFDQGWTASQVGKDGTSGTIVDPVPPISSYAYNDGVGIHRHGGGSTQTREIRVLTDNTSFSIPGTSIVIRQTAHSTSSVTFTVTGMGTTTTGVTFYQDINYGGTASQLLAKGTYTLSQLQAKGVQNDWASSCRIPAGWTVIMYQHDNFGGTSWTRTSDTPNFTSFSGLNDQMSSCKIQ
jgi:hypothetical protein